MRAKDRDRLAALRDIKSKLMLEATKRRRQRRRGRRHNPGHLEQVVEAEKRNRRPVHGARPCRLGGRRNRPSCRHPGLPPAALAEAEIEAKVNAIVAETGASSMADMGKVMGLATAAMAGQADGKVISGFVRKALTS